MGISLSLTITCYLNFSKNSESEAWFIHHVILETFKVTQFGNDNSCRNHQNLMIILALMVVLESAQDVMDGYIEIA